MVMGMMRLTDKTITDDASLMQEYSAIRKRGWSQDNRESALEGQCFGAPIRYGDKVIAAGQHLFSGLQGTEG